MIITYYATTFLLSVIFSIIYVFRWKKHFDVNITAVFILIPLSNLGQVLMQLAKTPREALLANHFIYVGGIFLPFFITYTIFALCGHKVNTVIRGILFTVNCLLFGAELSAGLTGLFYKNVTLKVEPDHVILVKEYGPVHTLFYVMLGVYLLAGLAEIIYSLIKKRQVSKKTAFLLLWPEIFSVLGFFGGRLTGSAVELIPLGFVFSQIVCLMIVEQVSLYHTSDMVIETMVERGENGFITFDFNKCYLGSNYTAREILPSLKELSVDESVEGKEELKKTVVHWINHFVTDHSDTKNKNLYIKKDPENPENDKMYSIQLDYLYNGKRKVGYQIILEDDTADQNYIRLLDNYNTELEEEVKKKTQRVVEMHDNLIMSMATMVESRDNSTGGHIRRTSVGVKLLIEEIMEDNRLHLSDEFCADIIKAAPMHDLGKIAVDDKILKKAGRFKPGEFEEMKKHAAQGAKIVHEILKETDDESFKIVAENVAHYHHERVDGSGYPEGLKGDEIPLEARIMAIADVYDALVSKRVYKEKMSFEEADKIIMEGMGKHFDESLKEYYVKARPKLEAYYSKVED